MDGRNRRCRQLVAGHCQRGGLCRLRRRQALCLRGRVCYRRRYLLADMDRGYRRGDRFVTVYFGQPRLRGLVGRQAVRLRHRLRDGRRKLQPALDGRDRRRDPLLAFDRQRRGLHRVLGRQALRLRRGRGHRLQRGNLHTTVDGRDGRLHRVFAGCRQRRGLRRVRRRQGVCVRRQLRHGWGSLFAALDGHDRRRRSFVALDPDRGPLRGLPRWQALRFRRGRRDRLQRWRLHSYLDGRHRRPDLLVAFRRRRPRLDRIRRRQGVCLPTHLQHRRRHLHAAMERPHRWRSPLFAGQCE